jgi:hypothetical protein
MRQGDKPTSGPSHTGALDASFEGTHRHAPIAVFAYNRADRLAGMMTSLRDCEGFAESPVRIFVDGPKSEDDANGVAAVRDYVRNLRLPNVTSRFSDSNRGLRQSIFSGVTEVVEQYGRAIVLEDDLVLSPIALRYFNEGLRRYETEERVWSIAAYTYDAPALRNSNTTLSLPFAHPWGWATWERNWKRFHLDCQPRSHDLHTRSFSAAFDMNGLYPFSIQLQNSIDRHVNSWFVHWYYTVFRNGGVSIFPPRRIVDNYGMNDGTHGGALNPYEKLIKRPQLLEELPKFGDALDVDYTALDALRTCREMRVQRFIARAGSAKRKLKAAGALR